MAKRTLKAAKKTIPKVTKTPKGRRVTVPGGIVGPAQPRPRAGGIVVDPSGRGVVRPTRRNRGKLPKIRIV